MSPLSGNYCGSGLKGKEEVLNKKPLVQEIQKRGMEKKQFKKEEPRGLECYRRRCKQEDCTYIHTYIFWKENITCIFRKREQSLKIFPKVLCREIL